MTLTRKQAEIFHCVCNHCQHAWKAFSEPDRCAKCGRRSWNGVDKRRGKGKFVVTKTRVEQ